MRILDHLNRREQLKSMGGGHSFARSLQADSSIFTSTPAIARYDMRALGTDGDTINTVSDLSGNGWTLTAGGASNRPTFRATGFNGKGCLEFITDDYLWTGAQAHAARSEVVLYMAVEVPSNPVNEYKMVTNLVKTDEAAGTFRRLEVEIRGSTFDTFRFWYQGGSTNSPAFSTTPRIVEFRLKQGTSISIRSSDGWNTTGAVASLSPSPNGLSLGSGWTSGGPGGGLAENVKVALYGLYDGAVLDTLAKRDAMLNAYKLEMGL